MLPLLLACAQAPTVAPPGALVAVVDSLRADHLDLGGYPAGARIYTEAYSASPWTSSSTWTLTTGQKPSADLRAQMAPWDLVLSTTRGWMAASGEGWPTAVVTDHSVVAWAWGVAEQPYRHAEEGVDLDQGGRVYLHVHGAHSPYAGLTGLYAAGPDRRYQDHLDARNSGGEARDLPPDLAAWAPLAYEAAADHAQVRMRGLVSDAVARGWTVILTADHGEALGEDGLWEHSSALHDPQVRVPLVVWGPGVKPGTDATPVPATCVAATVRGDGCDLRRGRIEGIVRPGMSVDGDWVRRHVAGTDEISAVRASPGGEGRVIPQ